MRKNDKLTVAAAAAVLAIIALLLCLPRNAGGIDQTAAGAAAVSAKPTVHSEAYDDAEPMRIGLGKTMQTTEDEKTRIETELQAIGELCRTYYLHAERIPSEYSDEDISQADIDAMEEVLSKAGYCVVNSDAFYPEYLENHEDLIRFWNDIGNERDAETEVWSVSANGSICCRLFQYADGAGSCIHASGDWNDDGSLNLSCPEKRDILYWDMTESGFLYQDIYFNRHWNAAVLLRLRPVDRSLYELTEKYISPVGYHNVNLFLLDWDSADFGNVCFNDLLSGMYRMAFGERLNARDYPCKDEPFFHSEIPEELFEAAVFEHFDIPLKEFRERALYNAENGTYPWQDIDAGNVLYFPELIPEAVDLKKEPDGTVRLLVRVMCPDRHTVRLFEHEITMRMEEDGAFQYLSNRIVYRSDMELPSTQARIEAQRF